jgi:hypothetical protein
MHDDDHPQALLRQALPVTDMARRAKPGDRWPHEPPALDDGPGAGVREPRRPHPDHPSDALMLTDEGAADQP